MTAGVAFAFLAGLIVGTRLGIATPTVLALLLTAAIFLYDGWLKRTLVGPVGMGACRFLNVLLGMSPAAADVLLVARAVPGACGRPVHRRRHLAGADGGAGEQPDRADRGGLRDAD